MKELGQIGHLAASLPWSVAEYDRVRKTMGGDFWSYGVAKNRHVLETLTRYGFIPAGATCELFMPISSNARRTSPDALASSIKAVT